LAQNPAQNADLRVRRTRKLLQEAMIALTIEKGFASLTVRDIAERAMVNRATFYRHYLDKYDLLDQYADELYALLEVADEVSLEEKQAGPETPPIGLVRLLDQVREHAAFFRAMLGRQGDPGFSQKIRQYIEKRMRKLLAGEVIPVRAGAPPLDMGLSYISAAGAGALVWWLENGAQISPEQMAAWMSQLSSADLSLWLGDRGGPSGGR
jgi:AcrR family transcriptional regulator